LRFQNVILLALSVQNYLITTWSRPENLILLRVSYLVYYYDGNDVIFPSSALAITDRDLLVDDGRIGSVSRILIADVNSMNFVDDNCYSEAIFVKELPLSF
jgi:hypothetical protein